MPMAEEALKRGARAGMSVRIAKHYYKPAPSVRPRPVGASELRKSSLLQTQSTLLRARYA